MVGWFRTFSRDFSSSQNAGNRNRFVNEAGVKAIVFDRTRSGPVEDEWDGQFAIATIDSPGVEVTAHTTFRADEGDGSEIWKQRRKAVQQQ